MPVRIENFEMEDFMDVREPGQVPTSLRELALAAINTRPDNTGAKMRSDGAWRTDLEEATASVDSPWLITKRAFDAAANPTAILALLDEIDALKASAGAQAADEPVALSITATQINELAMEIASTEVYGDSMTNLQYVLIRGASAIGLPATYAKDMLAQLAKCQLEECQKWREVATVSALRKRVEEAECERDGWKAVCKRAGVCMSCALGAFEPYGCTDCLNTGWDGGAPAGFVPEQRIADLTRERDEANKDRGNSLKIANANHARWERAEAQVAELSAMLAHFTRHYEPWMDKHSDDTESVSFARHTFGDLRKARSLAPTATGEKT